MKTIKKILFVLAAFLVSSASAFLFASITDSNAVGATVFIVSFAPSIISLVNPRLKVFKAAFDLITPSQITWNGKEVMDMQSAIMDAIFINPDLATTNLIVEDIVAKEQIVFLGVLSKVSKKDAGCNGTPSSKSIDMREKFWLPQPVKFWIEECATNLEATFWTWGLAKGIERKDLTKGDFADFVMERLSSALLEDVMRIAWFNDLDSAHTNDSPAGHLSPTSVNPHTDVTDYNIIDGLWKQLFTIGANLPAQLVSIPNNAGVNYAAQAFTAADTTNKLITNILQNMIDNADTRLSEAENKGLMFYVTKSVYNQYKRELKSYAAIDQAWIMIQNGQKVLSLDGIPIMPISFWDRTIKADFDNGTKLYLPHRALLTVKENIPIGVDSKSSLGAISSFYLPKEETTNWKGAYKIDAKVLQEYLVMLAY